MDPPSEATRHHGGTLVFPDMPAHSAIGIDQFVYTVGESFKGVKHVPCGVHVVSYAAYDATGDRYGPVTAMFVEVPAVERTEDDRYVQQGMASSSKEEAWMMDSAFHGPVLGWTWAAQDEVLVRMDEDVLRRAESMVRSMRWDRQLGSYMSMHSQFGTTFTAAFDQWHGLSGYVNTAVMRRHAPKEGSITATAEEDPQILLNTKKSKAEVALEQQLGTGASADAGGQNVQVHGGRCRFTSLPGPLIKDASLSAEERTAWNMDKSRALERLLVEQYGKCTGDAEAAFLGELQFAFLAFLLGHSLEGFLQWKKMIALLLGCDEAVRKRPDLFVRALDVVYRQLSFGCRRNGMDGRTVSGEVVSEQLFDDHFLRALTTQFIRSHTHDQECDDPCDPRVRRVVARLGDLVSHELHWDCGGRVEDLDEEDEDGPVVVYL
jgi:A1 cistron-splicing factor AAR2